MHGYSSKYQRRFEEGNTSRFGQDPERGSLRTQASTGNSTACRFLSLSCFNRPVDDRL